MPLQNGISAKTGHYTASFDRKGVGWRPDFRHDAPGKSRRAQLVSLHGATMPGMTQTKPSLVVSITSSALFDLAEGDRVYQEQGLAAYAEWAREQEDQVLEPGQAYHLVRKLLHINSLLEGAPRVEVILLSRNTADTGLRVFNSIQHHGLNITRAAFCGGQSPHRYVSSFGSHLFLSTEARDVRLALEAGHAAATILGKGAHASETEELRFAFDGDAVLFSDEAERIYKQDGLAAFTSSEKAAARTPLEGGPFKPFLAALQKLQAEFPRESCPIHTGLFTARSAPAHERVIRTLRSWEIRLDESLFLGGMPKSDFLRAFNADVFFDDQPMHCDLAREHVATGHVPHGVVNIESGSSS